MPSEVIFDQERHEYRDELGTQYLSVTQILRKSGKYHFAPGSEEAMNRGTKIHFLIELLEQQALNARALAKPMRPYRHAWLAFKKATGFQVKSVEDPFISFTYGYAGKVDCFGSISKSLAVLDLKTGTAIPPATRLQLVAYAHHKALWPIRRIAVRLCPDQNPPYRVKEYPLETYAVDWAEFYQLLRRVQCR